MTLVLPPVSSHLLDVLQDDVQKRTLIIWLDADDRYSAFVDHLMAERAKGRLNFDILGYRGSYLELMLQVEPLTAGTDRQPLVVHLPGFNTTTVRETPLLELYSAGKVFQKALSTLVEEAAATRVPAPRIANFLASSEVTLAAADVWLAEALNSDSDGLTGELRRLKLTEIVRELQNKDSDLSGRFRHTPRKDDFLKPLVARLNALTGASSEWLETDLATSKVPLSRLIHNVVRWALCVEYVTDLTRAPKDVSLHPIPQLPAAVQRECCALAAELRKSAPEFYIEQARATEDELLLERTEAQPDDLGKIDTFPFEEEAILDGAIAALKSGQWERALQWADDRRDEQCFWLRSDINRRSAWQLIAAAARLGQTIAAAGPNLRSVTSVDHAVDVYVERGSHVDHAHRRLEQQRDAWLSAKLPKSEAIRERLDASRQQWRIWADEWAKDFNALCRRDGFLPSPALQQRHFFQDVVIRSASGDSQGTTVLFLIDAMRFELAQELSDSLREPGTANIQLKARLAELPSVTEVGMNVLAPVCQQGRLFPTVKEGKFLGFSTGAFRVYDPETRRKAMHDRVGGRTCPRKSLDEILSLDRKKLAMVIGQASLMIVDSREIDEAGHAGVGPSVFDKTLQDLRRAMHLLRDAGAQNFVITADHGFLLLRDVEHPLQTHGSRNDPADRYVISPSAADHSNEVRVSLRDLGYESEDLHVMFPLTTATFDTGKKDRRYVHGGNSLQERVIPVLTVQHAVRVPRSSKERSSRVRYQIKAKIKRGIAGMHAIEATLCLDSSSSELQFGGAEQKELALRVMDGGDVQVSLQGVSGGATLKTGAILATVGEPFDVFFRLNGPDETRVRVELFHPVSPDLVTPGTVVERFDVTCDVRVPVEVAPDSRSRAVMEVTQGATAKDAWLQEFSQAGLRRVFQHLWQHSMIAESDVALMLEHPREARKFARQIDEYADKIPFRVRCETVGGIKRYVREGGDS
ncbi:MAG: BREX-6 system phosphatase PglZ [Planctomycetia bacterium]